MNFNPKTLKTLLAVGLFSLTSGCIKSDKPKDQLSPNGAITAKTAENLKNIIEKEERQSSFFINGEAVGKVVGAITTVDGDSKDIRGLKYQFEVCLGDRDTLGKLQKFRFKVESSKGENPVYSQVEMTDERGCLIWTEEITFDIAKQDPQPVVMIRKIKSVEGSSRSGEASFLFQVFPWEFALNSQAHPVFYHLRGNERYNHSFQILRLLEDDTYNPREKLMSLEGEEGRLFVKRVNYDLTAFPFSLIKKDLQPTESEVADKDFRLNSLSVRRNYVSLPDGDSEDDDWEQKRIANDLPTLSDMQDDQNPAFDGLKVNLVLKVNLSQSYTGLNGLQPRDVRSGRFKILPYIYATDYNSTGDRVLLNPGMEAQEAVVDLKGDLNVLYAGILPFAPTSGRVELALRIEPMDTNASKYKIVEEIFTIGNYDDLIGKSTNAWENPKQFNQDFDFVKYAKESNGYDEALTNSSIKKAEPFEFSLAAVKHKTIEAGETANRRTVIFNVNTCVNTINFNSKVLEGKEFEVVSRHFKTPGAEKIDETLRGETRYRPELSAEIDFKDRPLYGDLDGDKIKTDSKGCLNFIDKINHKYYQTERLIRRKYYITAKDGQQNFTKELVLYLNPWDEKFGTLGTDARSVSQTFLNELNERKKIVPRFFIKDFGYETLRFRYEIDKNMNLDVKKTVLLRMRPLVLRYSNVLQGINSIHDLRDGIYLLKVAYQKDYLDPAAKNIRLHSGLREQNGRYVLSEEAQLEKTAADGETVIRTDKQAQDDKAYSSAQNQPIDGSLDVVAPYDPSRKTAISIVKKLVRINAGNVVTPIEFGVDDLRLLRIRAQFFAQIEPINQTRLQIVNMASRKIEEVLALKKGEPSDLAKLPVEEQREIIQKKMFALDTLATAIPDNIEYSVEDPSELLAVFAKPEIITAFSYFMPGGMLSSVEEMLKRGDAANYIGPDSIISAMKTEENFVDKIALINQNLEAQTTPEASERNFSVTTRRTERGKEFQEHNYESSDEFNKICGESHKGYDSCVAEHSLNNADFNVELCRCYDKSSEDYAPVTTKEGEALNTIEEIEKEIARLRAEAKFVEARNLMEQVKKNSAEFFGGLTTESALIDLLLNDFTLAQAEADISDLDLLKDEVIKGVDIEARTFVGPLTFLNNSNSGSLRPTDNLDEAYCITDDCNSLGSDPLAKYGAIQNFDYERSPYHGSIAHFANVTVDDFINGTQVPVGNKTMKIPSYKKFKENKKKVFDVKSLLSNFVEEFNLNYVSLKDKKLKKFVCANPEQVNFETGECLEDYTKRHWKKESLQESFEEHSKDSLYSYVQNDSRLKNITDNRLFKYEGPLEADFDMSFLDEIIKKDHGGNACTKNVVPASHAKFSKNEYAKFCSLMTYGILKKNLVELSEDFQRRSMSGEFTQKYLKYFVKTQLENTHLRKNGVWVPDTSFHISTVYKKCLELAEKGEGNEPLYIERKYRIADTGRYYYLGGKSLNINLSQTIGISHSTGSNKSLKFDPSKFLTSFIPAKFDLFGYSYTKNESLNANAGTSVSQGTFLVMQNAEFDVELKKYEQCLVIRWSEGLKAQHKTTFYDNAMIREAHDSNLTTDDGKFLSTHMVDKLGEGLMVCSGDLEDTPIAVRETYYYFTQHSTEGDMQDRADIHNHPWLLSLRGVREYETFLAATHADHDVSEKDAADEFVHAHELVGMKKMIESDLAGEMNLDGTSFESFDKYKRNGWPLTQLVKTYRKISPTFPGLYTQLSRKEYQVDQWPWVGSQAGDNFTSNQTDKDGVTCSE
jgi:hypothetical protein